MKTTEQIIDDVVNLGGALVSSGDCSEMEIAIAKTCGRFAARDDGMGFVRRPKEWLAMAMEMQTEAAIRRLLVEAQTQ